MRETLVCGHTVDAMTVVSGRAVCPRCHVERTARFGDRLVCTVCDQTITNNEGHKDWCRNITG